jgi:anaerobic selenocysteine-containing dehydrogenase
MRTIGVDHVIREFFRGNIQDVQPTGVTGISDGMQQMGFAEPCFADDDETLARAAFRPELDFDALRAHGWLELPIADAPFAEGGFPTADGRCIVASPAFGVPDFVPNHESVASTPDLARRYPLAMISPPARNFLNSSFVNVKSLRDIEGEPVVEIHEADARCRGIASGQMVRVFNDRGSTLCRAAVSPRARPGVVNGLGVWWRKLGADGTNVNELTHQRLTDLGRAPSFYDCLVEVEAPGGGVPPPPAGRVPGRLGSGPASAESADPPMS